MRSRSLLAATSYFVESGYSAITRLCIVRTIVVNARGEVHICGSMPWVWCIWLCEWLCVQLPASKVIPDDRSTIRSLSAMRSTRLCSKVMRPVDRSSCAWLASVSWRAVGSYVSGLAPSGTSTSTGKSPQVISSTNILRGVILTNMVFSAVWLLSPLQLHRSVIIDINIAKRLFIPYVFSRYQHLSCKGKKKVLVNFVLSTKN